MRLPTTIWRPAYGDILRTLLSIIAVAGVLIVFLNQQNSQAQQLKTEQKTVATLISLGKQRSMQINDLQKHIDCLFVYFSTPGRTGDTTIVSDRCDISKPTPVPASTPSSTPVRNTQVTTPTPQPSPAVTPAARPPSSQPAPARPSPVKTPGLVRQILNFLGL